MTSNGSSPTVPAKFSTLISSSLLLQCLVWSEAHKANQLVSQYAYKHDKVTFIDTTGQLINEKGEPKGELFVWLR